jgi:hypothetical protein
MPFQKGNPYRFKKGSIIGHKFKKGHLPTKSCFKKGHIPWNKDKKLPQFSGKNSCHWKGGKIKNDQGYILIYMLKHPFCECKGYVRRSRLVVEEHLGRYLKPKNVIHHINGIRDDDRLKNFIVFVNNSVHKCFHGNPNNVKSSEIIFDGRKL